MARIGFHVFYRDTEVGRAVARLADLADRLSHDVTLHSPAKPGRVDPRWDKHVLDDSKMLFVDWLKECEIVVWVDPPGTTIMRLASSKGCRTVLLSTWDTLIESSKECHQMADIVISPSEQGTQLLRENWSLRNCRFIPWDTGLPMTRKEVNADHNRVRLLFPMYGDQPSRAHPTALHLIRSLIHNAPFADVSLIYNPRAWTTEGFKTIRRMERTFGPSGQFMADSEKDLTHSDILLRYGRSDVTIWPSLYEGFAMVGLESLAMGTPVVAYDVPPQTEYLHNDRNARLVPCELEYNWLGAPKAQSNQLLFEEHILRLINDHAAIEQLKRFTRYGLADRRSNFEGGWAEVFTR